MGRYSTVQAYADNHSGIRKVPYEQAAAAATSDGGGNTSTTTRAFVPPEKVVNPYGSTAGAGSGEFHVYRHARNRELQRQKYMELSAQEQQAEDQFREQLKKNAVWEEERTAKRRKKRERQKNAKKRKENLAKLGIGSGGKNPGMVVADDDDDNDTLDKEEEVAQDPEFTYTPGEALAPIPEKDVSNSNDKINSKQSSEETNSEPRNDNDGKNSDDEDVATTDGIKKTKDP